MKIEDMKIETETKSFVNMTGVDYARDRTEIYHEGAEIRPPPPIK